MSRLRSEQGLMLNELLVAISVALAVFGSTVVAFGGFLNQNRIADRQAQAQDKARLSVDRILTQLRSGASADNETIKQPIQSVSAYDLVFLTPRENVAVQRNARGLVFVRYCLDTGDINDEDLWTMWVAYDSTSQRTAPSVGGCPNSSWPNQQQLASNLINNLQSPTVPLFNPTTDASGNVTDLAIQTVVDTDVTKPPKAIDLRSSVTLRNLNRSPVPSLNCQVTNGHVICDASGSSDPDGQSISFAWALDSNPLAETSYRLDQSPVSSGTHNVTVTLTDTGGVTASTTQTVTVP
jgi:hypothetical protein